MTRIHKIDTLPPSLPQSIDDENNYLNILFLFFKFFRIMKTNQQTKFIENWELMILSFCCDWIARRCCENHSLGKQPIKPKNPNLSKKLIKILLFSTFLFPSKIPKIPAFLIIWFFRFWKIAKFRNPFIKNVL